MSVSKLQLLQSNLQNVQVQKHQVEEQLSEFDSSLTELAKTKKAYKIIGKIMLAQPIDKLQAEMKEKKEVVQIRFSNFIKQEEKLQKEIEETQKKVMEELK
jgi:prefoldin beta subunit